MWLCPQLRGTGGKKTIQDTNGFLVSGDLTLKKGAFYKLDLNYNGSQDLSFLQRVGPLISELGTRNLPITDEQAAKLFKWTPNLQYLSADRTDITDDGVKYLLPLKKLTTISMCRGALTSGSLAVFGRLPRLTHLLITHNQFSDAALANLSKLHNLQRLRLNNTGITDAGLVHIEPLTGLTQLHISGNQRITNAGIAHLKQLKNLVELQIWETNVTPLCAKTLQQLPKLKRVVVSFNRLGERGTEELKQALGPSVKVSNYSSRIPIEVFAPLHSPIAPQNTDRVYQ